MFIFLLDSSKNLTISKSSTNYKLENLAEKIWFILPQTISGYNLTECVVQLYILNQNNIGNSYGLPIESELYQDTYLQSYFDINSILTQSVGNLEMWINITHVPNSAVIKTNSVYMTINDKKTITDYFSEVNLETLVDHETRISVLEASTGIGTIPSENVTYTSGDISNVKEALDISQNKYLGIVKYPVYVDNLNGTITIGNDGIFNFSTIAETDDKFVRLSATGSTISLINESVNYVYVDYNGGSPIYGNTTNQSIFYTDNRLNPIFRITRYGNDIAILKYDKYGVGLSSKMLYKDIIIHGFERQSGLILSTSATRIPSVTEGAIWFGVEVHNLAENIGGSVGELYEWYLVSGVWQRSLVTTYDNQYYSDGTNRLTLSNNKFVAKYFFRVASSDKNCVHFVHGNTYGSISEAIAENVPLIPSYILSSCIYVGKIIIQKNATTGTAYPRDWNYEIKTTASTSHENLSNILQAGIGVLNGHISNLDQTIYGAKTFDSPIASSTANMTESTNKNFVSDSESTALGSGVSGSFVSQDGKIVTVTNGIITGIV